MVHDRGTSILLGRPLGIAPYDSNTPRPSRPKNGQLPLLRAFRTVTRDCRDAGRHYQFVVYANEPKRRHDHEARHEDRKEYGRIHETTT